MSPRLPNTVLSFALATGGLLFYAFVEFHAPASLVEAFLPLVRAIAERIHRRLPPGMDLDSLVQAGVMGLLEAHDRYNPDRGAFPAYARYRIQGEIMEYLRSLFDERRRARHKAPGQMRHHPNWRRARGCPQPLPRPVVGEVPTP